MKVLLDSSVWIAWQQNTVPTLVRAVEQVLTDHFDDLVGCAPVRMELGMAASATSRNRVERLYGGLASVSVTEDDFDGAADIYRDVQRSGHTVRSILDCLIAAIAVREEALVVHADRDFDRIGAVIQRLQLRRLGVDDAD
jgi:predicted nucleic acid-binding protein